MDHQRSDNAENFKSPPSQKDFDHFMEHNDVTGFTTDSKKLPSTPAIQRLHKTLREFNVHSPSDSILSPCSQKLADADRVRKGHQAHNQAQKQKTLKSKYGNANERPVMSFESDEDEAATNSKQESRK
ncbi:Spo12 family-containing protein [Aphelenchoides bicaudatus]|nr:Spo12 family-containing protein [Aphelenchoides bicaudatus]